jgi:hypothetical protein
MARQKNTSEYRRTIVKYKPTYQWPEPLARQDREQREVRRLSMLLERHPDLERKQGVVPGTRIATGVTSAGQLLEQPVESLVPGDEVLAWDPEECRLRPQPVVAVVVNEATEVIMEIGADEGRRLIYVSQYQFFEGTVPLRPCPPELALEILPTWPFPAYIMVGFGNQAEVLLRDGRMFYLGREWVDNVGYACVGGARYERLCPDRKLYTLVVEPAHHFIANGFHIFDGHVALSSYLTMRMRKAHQELRDLGVK